MIEGFPENAAFLLSEITPEQVKMLVERLQALNSGLPEISSIYQTDEQLTETYEEMIRREPHRADLYRYVCNFMIEDKDYKWNLNEAVKEIAFLDTSARYRLADVDIVISDYDSVPETKPHIIQMAVYDSPEIIDDQFYSVTTKIYKVEMISGQPEYHEKQEIFDRQTHQRQRTRRQEELHQIANEAEDLFIADRERSYELSAEYIRRIHEDVDSRRALGVNIFTQEKFQEAMAIIDQLGPENRVK